MLLKLHFNIQISAHGLLDKIVTSPRKLSATQFFHK